MGSRGAPRREQFAALSGERAPAKIHRGIDGERFGGEVPAFGCLARRVRNDRRLFVGIARSSSAWHLRDDGYEHDGEQKSHEAFRRRTGREVEGEPHELDCHMEFHEALLCSEQLYSMQSACSSSGTAVTRPILTPVSDCATLCGTRAAGAACVDAARFDRRPAPLPPT